MADVLISSRPCLTSVSRDFWRPTFQAYLISLGINTEGERLKGLSIMISVTKSVEGCEQKRDDTEKSLLF